MTLASTTITRPAAAASIRAGSSAGGLAFSHNDSRSQIEFMLPADGKTTVTLFNTQGRHIATLFDGQAEAGRHTVRVNVPEQTQGLYFAKLESNGKVLMSKMMLRP